jgi:FdhE protein
MILQHTSESALPQAAQETITGLMRQSEPALEGTADRILAGELSEISPPELPLVAAALQVSWVHMALSLKESEISRRENGGVCPVCASSPLVGIVRSTGPEQGLRYLTCSLCATEWHMVRLKCSTCDATDKLNYYTLEGLNGAVKTESCDNCNSYLKLLYLEKDRQREATADDLATLALDMLMDQKGKVRRGPNLFFHPGQSR